MDSREIISRLPYSPPFLFVDDLVRIDENGVEGTYRFLEDLDFYRGHFKDQPVTPGVILTECCAQIGLVCLGIYLCAEDEVENTAVALSSAAMDFYQPVFPGDKVTVLSERVYFRFNKLKCKVRMLDKEGVLVCKGELAGMVVKQKHE